MTAPEENLPMTSLEHPRTDVRAHAHAVCLFDAPEDLARHLRAFLDEGVARNELCVFVHGFESDEEAWELVERARPDRRRLRDDRVVVVRLYREAFEGGAKEIDRAHVQRFVDAVLDSAAEEGRAGVRLFVDASRRYFEEDRDEEWFAFEAWLGRRLHTAVGLVCAYRTEDALRPDLFPHVLRTHAYRFEASAGA